MQRPLGFRYKFGDAKQQTCNVRELVVHGSGRNATKTTRQEPQDQTRLLTCDTHLVFHRLKANGSVRRPQAHAAAYATLLDQEYDAGRAVFLRVSAAAALHTHRPVACYSTSLPS